MLARYEYYYIDMPYVGYGQIRKSSRGIFVCDLDRLGMEIHTKFP